MRKHKVNKLGLKAHKNNGVAENEVLSMFEQLKLEFNNCSDIIFTIKKLKQSSIGVSYIESLVNVNYIDKIILPKLDKAELQCEEITKCLEEEFLTKELTDKKSSELQYHLLSGYTLLFAAGKIFAVNVTKIPGRNPEESAIEPSIRGPRDGFVEDLNTNIALIRKRFKSNQLRVEKYIVGKRSNTTMALLYVEDIINKDLLKTVKKKIDKLDVDIVSSVQQIDKLLSDQPHALTSTSDNSGRPDFVLEALNQGRFALIIDGQPMVSIAPVHLVNLIKSPEDLNQNYLYVSFERILRLVSLFISILLPGFWVALTSHNVDQIPFLLVATISVSRIGIPLSTSMEMFIMLFLFELFHEAGMRLPRSVGQTVSVLGGLIVGDAAIRSGLTSPSMLVVGGIVFVSGYTLVNPALSGTATLLRIFILFLGTFFGIFGVVLGVLLTIAYFSSLTSFGIPYLGFSDPFRLSKLAKTVFRMPWNSLSGRDPTLQPDDTTRKEK
ncbi:spore germination protein [Pseudalkalibacillus caeni]|uniref:spore germination protein n=1 Tax=Exobacillus caeni TaxID=2574798 RepID=UPI001485A291|nr:spore germination protein [Pseudalkalibacillus caeni]